MRWYIK